MCGLAAWIRSRPAEPADAQSVADALLKSIARRGPDGQGAAILDEGRVGLVHARLAIIDVAARSDQPLKDPETGVSIVYNGELYNYRQLREQLQARGVRFQTTSDTEVILRGYMTCGADFLRKLRGMYAFVVYDPRNRVMAAVRDPLGIKPLYVRRTPNAVFVGSSAAGIARCEGGAAERDPAAAVSFVVLGCVLDPLSPYRGVGMLPPGVLHTWTLDGEAIAETRATITPDVDAPSLAAGDIAGLEAALEDSVCAHFTSDVPVAVFQSGGLDSRLITTLAKRRGLKPHLITLSFEEFRGTKLDEMGDVAAFAKSAGLEHYGVYLNNEVFVEKKRAFLADMETPTVDAINTYLVSGLAKEMGYKVALSGVGGDELFAGYPSFYLLPSAYLAGKILTFPPVRAVAGELMDRISQRRNLSPKFARAIEYAGRMSELYMLKRAVYLPEDALSVLDRDVYEAGKDAFLNAYGDLVGSINEPSARTIGVFEENVYLRNMLLKDADWAGMAHGVEIRTPFVDIVLRSALHGEGGGVAFNKEDLRKVLAKVSGAPERPRRKTGFSVPYQHWFDPERFGGSIASGRSIRYWSQEVLESCFPGWGAPAERGLLSASA